MTFLPSLSFQNNPIASPSATLGTGCARQSALEKSPLLEPMIKCGSRECHLDRSARKGTERRDLLSKYVLTPACEEILHADSLRRNDIYDLIIGSLEGWRAQRDGVEKIQTHYHRTTEQHTLLRHKSHSYLAPPFYACSPVSFPPRRAKARHPSRGELFCGQFCGLFCLCRPNFIRLKFSSFFSKDSNE